MWQLFVKLVLTILLVIDPIGIIPQYMSVTSNMSEDTKRTVIKKAVCIAALVLLVFILFGRVLLQFFGELSNDNQNSFRCRGEVS